VPLLPGCFCNFTEKNFVPVRRMSVRLRHFRKIPGLRVVKTARTLARTLFPPRLEAQ
jgi:hypothetical protein